MDQEHKKRLSDDAENANDDHCRLNGAQNPQSRLVDIVIGGHVLHHCLAHDHHDEVAGERQDVVDQKYPFEDVETKAIIAHCGKNSLAFFSS